MFCRGPAQAARDQEDKDVTLRCQRNQPAQRHRKLPSLRYHLRKLKEEVRGPQRRVYAKGTELFLVEHSPELMLWVPILPWVVPSTPLPNSDL